MSDLTSHLLAIGAGVGIALLFMGGRNSKPPPPKQQQPPRPNAREAAAAPGAARSSGKKKNKKKNKKKAATASAPAERAAEPPVSVSTVPPPAPAAAASNGGKKKKTRAKTSGAGASSGPGPEPPGSGNETSAPRASATAGATTAKPPGQAAAPATAPPVPATPPQPRAQAEEEEAWETIPKRSKKKKKGPSPQQRAQASPSPAPAPEKVSVSVVIPASRIGIVIGPKGATMNKIQEKTGTKLDVNAPKPGETKPSPGRASGATVVVSEGSPETRLLAKKAILELADRGYASLLQAEGFGESSVAVHPRFLSEIVGPGGKIIKAIQSGLDVKLTIPKTDWTPKTMQIGNVAPSVRVGIAGDSPQNVKTAKQVVRDLCNVHHHEITHPGLVHQEVHVPHEFFHCVIGTRGSEIKHIRGNYHVDVYMPSTESWCTTENVICVGKPNDVEKAISYIKLLMDRDSELREQKYSDDAFGDDSFGW